MAAALERPWQTPWAVAVGRVGEAVRVASVRISSRVGFGCRRAAREGTPCIQKMVRVKQRGQRNVCIVCNMCVWFK